MRKLFIISDLHLGGRPHQAGNDGQAAPGFQFNHSYPALIAFIDWVAKLAEAGEPGETELVINGDIVDFLAEDDYQQGAGAKIWTANEQEAVAKLEQIVRRTCGPDGRGVFGALKDFAMAGNRLTLLLGNHDVELSMPMVRRRLRQLLGTDTNAVNFIYDGEAYTIGRVLIEHGNRYDRWNMLDYSGLRQERSMRSRRLEINEGQRQQRYFVPPAGTHLVIHFMNRVKARYRFIDLLKPETAAIVPLLVALEPGKWKYLNSILDARPIVSQYSKDGLATPTEPKRSGNLEQQAAGAGVALDDLLVRRLGKKQAALFIAPHAADSARMRHRGDQDLGFGSALAALTQAAGDWIATRHEQWSGAVDSFSSLVKINRADLPEERLRQLHIALKHVHEQDGSFDPGRESSEYLDAAKGTVRSGDFDIVIYGHTHLPKKARIDHAGQECWYLNTGTWCDVLRLPEQIAAEYEAAKPALEDFVSALALDRFDRYIKRYLTFVELAVDPESQAPVAEPALYTFCGAGRERCAALTDYPMANPT